MGSGTVYVFLRKTQCLRLRRYLVSSLTFTSCRSYLWVVNEDGYKKDIEMGVRTSTSRKRTRRPSADPWSIRTIAVRGKRPGVALGNDRTNRAACPIPSCKAARDLFVWKRLDIPIYARIWSFITHTLGQRIADLEGASAGLVFASGMAAIHAVIHYVLFKNTRWKPGKKIPHGVVVCAVYGGTVSLLTRRIRGARFTFIHSSRFLRRIEKAIQPGVTKFIFLESLPNPIPDLADIKAIAALAHKYKIELIVDNTLAPTLVRPIELGATIVVYSLTKHFGNGYDIGGAVVGQKETMLAILKGVHRDFGACMSAAVAEHMLENIAYLPLVMRSASESAAQIAEFLSKQRGIKCVHYPSKDKMPEGGGVVVSFEVANKRVAHKLIDSLKVFVIAANMGGAFSLVILSPETTHGPSVMTNLQRKRAGIADGLIRLSIGWEDPRLLMTDLRQGLRKAVGPVRAR